MKALFRDLAIIAGVAGALAIVSCATGCGLLGPDAPDVDPCAAEIIKLEGLRTAEIAAKCQGQSFDDCLPTIDSVNAKYDPLIAEQVRCGQ